MNKINGNNHLKNLKIHGYRGFAKPEKIGFSLPNGKQGSGLTIFVGPNNAGKSTIVEVLKIISRPNNPYSFSEGKRNKNANDRISIIIETSKGEKRELVSQPQGGSETHWLPKQNDSTYPSIFVLPSRRTFNPFFGKGVVNRKNYINSYELPPARRQPSSGFSSRLFKIQENPDNFNNVLKRVLEPIPDWYIERNDSDNYYLKFRTGNTSHNSDGLGEGLISLLFIVDSLYDSEAGDVIAIDEPELSLHPHLQRKLMKLLCDFSKDRQIIFATHSPYFIDWNAIINGATIVRVKLQNNRSKIYELTTQTKTSLGQLLTNHNNPHILGLNAKEVFFLEDKIILVEGQEDVVCYPKILNQIDFNMTGNFFGWGVGGKGNMPVIAKMLKELGFEKVAGILDNNATDTKKNLETRFPKYFFATIPADDVRTKPKQGKTDEVVGLLDEKGKIREHFKEETIKIFTNIKKYFGEPA